MAEQLTKIYSDIDFAFTRTPGRNDIALSYDDMAVIRAIKYILLTNKYERPFQSDLGSGLTGLLFEPVNYLTAESISLEIESMIRNHEPRVSLVRVTVDEKPDDNAYNVGLTFFIGNNTQPTTIGLILERTR